jgi:hypothetical protein
LNREVGGFQAAGFLEQQSIGDAQQTDGQSRQKTVEILLALDAG